MVVGRFGPGGDFAAIGQLERRVLARGFVELDDHHGQAALAVDGHEAAVADTPDEVEVAQLELIRASHGRDVDLQTLRLGRSGRRLLAWVSTRRRAQARGRRSHLRDSIRIIRRLDAVLNALTAGRKGRHCFAVILLERG